MIHYAFAFILGFGLVASLIGALIQEDSLHQTLIKTGLLLVILTTFGATGQNFGDLRGAVGSLVGLSFTQNISIFLSGGCVAIVWALFREGTFHDLWLFVHPKTAPTGEAKAGKRSEFTSRTLDKMGSTVIGSATPNFTQTLDLRTQTLIKLAYGTFSNRSAMTLSVIEKTLGLTSGKRQSEAQKLIASFSAPPSARPVVQNYWRAINGNYASARLLFSDLCSLAYKTGNRDAQTIDRLLEVGSLFRLSPQDMGQAIQSMR